MAQMHHCYIKTIDFSLRRAKKLINQPAIKTA